MVTEITKHVMQCLNRFPWKNGVSREMSPNTLVTGKPMPDYNNMRIEFGAYAQVFKDNTLTNTTKSRMVGAIALTATGNASGDYYFLSLATGAKLLRHDWVEVPITDTAIARVEALAVNEGQPLIQDQGLVVEWGPNQPIDDDEYNRNYVPIDEEDEEFNDYDPINQDKIDNLGDVDWPAENDGVHNHEEEPKNDENNIEQPDDTGIVSEEDEDEEDAPGEHDADDEHHPDDEPRSGYTRGTQ